MDINEEQVLKILTSWAQFANDMRAANEETRKNMESEKRVSKLVSDIKKGQDKYGRLNYFTAKNWRDLGNRIGNNIRLQLTKKSLLNEARAKGKKLTDEEASKAAYRVIATGSKGVFSGISKLIPIMSGFASTVGLILTAVEAILKIVGERGKYLKATSMLSSQGALNNASSLFRAATLHAGYVNDPMYHKAWAFTGSQEYKNAYRAMIESAVFSKDNYSSDATIRNLILAFDDIAAQGLVLGRSFQETSQLISSVGSQYYMGRSFNGLRNFSYIHDLMQQGRVAGFNDTNVMNMLTNYSKINAYNTNGVFLALNDISKFIRLISNNTGNILEKANPQQIASQMQAVLSANIPFGQFIALTKGLRSFGKSDLTGLAESYRKTGQLEKLGNMWNTLKSATKLDFRTLMTIRPDYFGGLQGEIGEKLVDIITKNPGAFNSDIYKNKSFTEALQIYAKKGGISAKESAEIRFYAQQQLIFEQPLQTIIACLISLGQSVVQIASVVAIGGRKPSAKEYANDAIGKITNMNKFNRSEGGGA